MILFMSLKKLSIILSVITLLSGCSADSDNNETASFSISAKQESTYDALIESTLNSFYWRYNSSSVKYEEGTVPTDEETLKCAAQSGYNMYSSSGNDCITATADLLYFNRETAGTVYFHFIGNNIEGLYYIPSNSDKPCNMYVRNAYISDPSFKSIETETELLPFVSKNCPNVNFEGIFDSITLDGVSYSILCNGTKLIINRSDKTTAVDYYKQIDLSSDGLIPISAAFIGNSTKIAVLYGTAAYSEDGAEPITVPQKIVMFDENFNITDNEIAAEDSDLYSVGYDNGYLMVARSRSIDFYPIAENGVGSKETSCYIGRSIIGMNISDLDGDGETEYIFTDGMDIFIYRKSGSVLKCIWSTHLSIDSFEKYIYTGDLNGDGVEEIYVFDSTGTTSRYLNGESGLYTGNENIDYGERYHVSDFNGDSKNDCFIIRGADVNTQEMRIVD